VRHVFVNRFVPGARANVTLDVARASRVAYGHLAGLGHTAIGHVAGPHDVPSARGREEAFLAAAAEHGHAEPPVARGAFTPSGDAAAGERLLTGQPHLTAVAMPLGELGAAAVDALAELLDGGAPSSRVLGSAPELVERAPTAPPPP
jgi:DNA-binding LacI/PurR family transcriptional regulator